MRTTGQFWQGRFGSVAMDEAHLVAALRYVALNPVRARLVKRATDWRWSSSRALCDACDDGVVTVAPVLERVGNFTAFLDEAFDEAFTYAALRKAESVGRPVGSPEWLKDMEARTGLTWRPRKRWPPPKGYLGVKYTVPVIQKFNSRKLSP